MAAPTAEPVGSTMSTFNWFPDDEDKGARFAVVANWYDGNANSHDIVELRRNRATREIDVYVNGLHVASVNPLSTSIFHSKRNVQKPGAIYKFETIDQLPQHSEKPQFEIRCKHCGAVLNL